MASKCYTCIFVCLKDITQKLTLHLHYIECIGAFHGFIGTCIYHKLECACNCRCVSIGLFIVLHCKYIHGQRVAYMICTKAEILMHYMMYIGFPARMYVLGSYIHDTLYYIQ